MFLKKLTIDNKGTNIRDVTFHKGINLIIDETDTNNKKKSGNDVGKTTVLRLINYCLGSDGKNIYQDNEFKNKTNTQIESFLKENNITITLTLKRDIEIDSSEECVIKRNFLSYSQKIQEINGQKYTNNEFPRKLKEVIFKSTNEKPKFRQIIAKNIRDEKNRLQNTVKVLNPYTSDEEYEALYLFWLGIDLDENERKQRLIKEKTVEENLQKRLNKETSISQIKQSLIVVKRTIASLEKRKESFNINEQYEEELSRLNLVKQEINRSATEISRLELREELITQSKEELEKEIAHIDTKQLQALYQEAGMLLPNIQKTFEETLEFHNKMIEEKMKYITKELPELINNIKTAKRKVNDLLVEEERLSKSLQKQGAVEELQEIINELNHAYENKGNLEEQERLWDSANETIKNIDEELDKINKGINSKDVLIQERIAIFNKYFSEISYKLYEEHFVLSSVTNDKGYGLNITTLSGNPGTGKKKGQIAAFDLAYILFADELNINCLHFILHDQIENVHDNQITQLLTDIVSKVRCQYILPVLRDKLPKEINIKEYEILSLSQTNKLFKV